MRYPTRIDVDWMAVKAAYETGAASVSQIARTHDVSVGTIVGRARSGKWVRAEIAWIHDVVAGDVLVDAAGHWHVARIVHKCRDESQQPDITFLEWRDGKESHFVRLTFHEMTSIGMKPNGEVEQLSISPIAKRVRAALDLHRKKKPFSMLSKSTAKAIA